MILIIPALELAQGICSRRTMSEESASLFYHDIAMNPRELARLWRTENAKTLHITDRDGLNGYENSDNRTAISEIVNSVDIPVQLLSHFPTVESCISWLESGVFRIIISTLVLDDPQGVAQLVREFTSSRIVLGVRATNGRVEFAGEYPAMSDTAFARIAGELGITRIIYSDQSWEGTYHGPDPETLKRISRETGMRITASGGIDSPEELWMVQELAPFNIDSVVIGRAMFENRFPCQRIWRSIEEELYRQHK